MNNYICEYLCEEHLRKICVRAYSTESAKRTVRAVLRQHGHKVFLKDIKVLYINNEFTPVNKYCID